MALDHRRLNALALRCWELHDQTRATVAALANPSLVSGPETAGRMLRRMQIGAVDMVLLHCMAWLAKAAEKNRPGSRLDVDGRSVPRIFPLAAPIDFQDIDDLVNRMTEETQQLVRDMVALYGDPSESIELRLPCEALAE